MAVNYELANDMIDDVPIMVTNNACNKVAAPAGDIFTVVSSAVPPVFVNATIGTMPSGPNAGSPSLRINALKILSTATETLTVSDADGLQVAVLPVDVVEDLTPKTITLDTVDVVHTPQPRPAS
jgi:hypothetical protein